MHGYVARQTFVAAVKRNDGTNPGTVSINADGSIVCDYFSTSDRDILAHFLYELSASNFNRGTAQRNACKRGYIRDSGCE